MTDWIGVEPGRDGGLRDFLGHILPDRVGTPRKPRSVQGSRQTNGGVGTGRPARSAQSLDMTREAFWPPNPKLLEIAVWRGISRAMFGT